MALAARAATMTPRSPEHGTTTGTETRWDRAWGWQIFFRAFSPPTTPAPPEDVGLRPRLALRPGWTQP